MYPEAWEQKARLSLSPPPYTCIAPTPRPGLREACAAPARGGLRGAAAPGGSAG